MPLPKIASVLGITRQSFERFSEFGELEVAI